MTSDARLEPWDAQLVDVAEPVRRVAAARLRDRHNVDDVVQETLTRLLVAKDRLDSAALLPYALVTARHLTADLARDRERHARLLPRVAPTDQPEQPEEALLRHEERRALAAALESLPAEDRRLLLAHEIDEVDTTALAEAAGNTPGGVAARLARTRARLRLDFVLALHGRALPSERCRPVLAALSSGDLRRQRALDAGRHLLRCDTCADLSGSVLARRRRLSALLPWFWLPALLAAVRRVLGGRGSTAVAAAGGLAATAVATVAVVTAQPDRGTRPSPPPAPVAQVPIGRLTVDGRPLPGAGPSLSRYIGQQVRGVRLAVLAVPADEGFWIRYGTRRIWVQLVTRAESRVTVRAGQRVTFTGTMVATPHSFPRAAGVQPAEGAGDLLSQGAHVRVGVADLHVERTAATGADAS